MSPMFSRYQLFFWLVTLLAATALAQPQPPDTVWTRTFGGAMYDEFHDVMCTADGGYLAVGETWSFGAGDRDWYVVKTDSGGNLQWSRTFGGIYDDCANAVVRTDDGGCAITGWLSGDTSRYGDFGLIKISALGDSLWGRVYGGSGDEMAIDLLQMSDGGFAVAGVTTTYGSGGRDVWLLRTDADGDSLWSRSFGGRSWDGARSVVQTPDGGFMLAGYTGSYGAGAFDMWLVRTDADGDSQWSRTYGGGSFDEASAMQQTSDGGFILAGYTDSFGPTFESGWVVKVDSQGDVEWDYVHSRGELVQVRDVLELTGFGYVIAGTENPSGVAGDLWLMRLDLNGDSVWSCAYGGTYHDDARALRRTTDGGYVLAGLKDWVSNTLTSGDAWLLKTEPDPLDAAERRVALPDDYSLLAYPNPFNSVCTIAYSVPRPGRVQIGAYDVMGRSVRQAVSGQQSVGEHVWILNGSGLSSGTYFVRLSTGESPIQTQKVLLLK